MEKGVRKMIFTKRHHFALAALRVSLGLLIFWWGMNRVVAPAKGIGLQDKFYFGLFPGEDLQLMFGYAQVVIGLLVIVGLFRFIVVPAQLGICLFSASTILPALLDPFGLWLPFDKISSVQHLFYPSMIIACAGVLMLLFREQDKINLDTFLFSRRKSEPETDEAIGVMPAE